MRRLAFLPITLSILCLGAGPGLPAKPTWGSLQLGGGPDPAPAPKRLEGTMPLAFFDGRTSVRLPGGATVPAEVAYRLPPQGKHEGASRLRYLLTSTLQEPVWKFETLFAGFDLLRLEPHGTGEAMRYAADDSLAGEQVRQDGPRSVRVSRQLMSLLRVSRCRLAVDIPLAGGETAYLERDLPGQGGLAAPGKWGWDTPGSPDWARVFLRHPYGLRANKVPEAGDYLDAAAARRLWKAIVERSGGPGLDPDYRTTPNVALVRSFELDTGDFLRAVERCLADAQLDGLRISRPGKATAASQEADQHLARARQLRDQGRFAEAAAALQPLRELEGRLALPAEVFYHQAACFEKGGDPGAAAEAYGQYLKRAGADPAMARVALERRPRVEAAARAQQEARARQEAAQGRAAQARAAIAAIDQELARLRVANDAIVAGLDAEAARLAEPFFQAFDAIPWPEKVFGYTSGKLMNFNRVSNHYYYRVAARTRDGQPVRRLDWGLGGRPGFDHWLEVDLRYLDRFEVKHTPGLPIENQYDLVITSWRLNPDKTRMQVDEPFLQRPYLWDRDQGHLDQVKRLEAFIAPYAKRCAEAREVVLAALDRQARLRDDRARLRAQALQ